MEAAGSRAIPAGAAAGTVTVSAQRTIHHKNQAGLVTRRAKAFQKARGSASEGGHVHHGTVASGLRTQQG